MSIAMAFIKCSPHHTIQVRKDVDIHVHSDHEWNELGQASH